MLKLKVSEEKWQQMTAIGRKVRFSWMIWVLKDRGAIQGGAGKHWPTTKPGVRISSFHLRGLQEEWYSQIGLRCHWGLWVGGRRREDRGREYRKVCWTQNNHFQEQKRFSVGSHGVMDPVSRLEPRVDKIKDFWRGSCVWQRICSWKVLGGRQVLSLTEVWKVLFFPF